MTVAIAFNIVCFAITILLTFTVGHDMSLKEKLIFISISTVFVVLMTLGVGIMMSWK